MSTEIHYFTVIVPFADPPFMTEWHPDHRGERLSRGAFPSVGEADAWAHKRLMGAPYGVTEVGWDEERGDWSRVVKAVPVCSRCLDVTPGAPFSDPAQPHPGPFTERLCAPCGRTVEADLRA